MRDKVRNMLLGISSILYFKLIWIDKKQIFSDKTPAIYRTLELKVMADLLSLFLGSP